MESARRKVITIITLINSLGFKDAKLINGKFEIISNFGRVMN